MIGWNCEYVLNYSFAMINFQILVGKLLEEAINNIQNMQAQEILECLIFL